MTRLIHLDPCPFCGADAEVVRDGTRRQSFQAACTGCHATQKGIDESCWNKRVVGWSELEGSRTPVAVQGSDAPSGGIRADTLAAKYYRRLADHYAFRGDGKMEWDKVYLEFKKMEAEVREDESKRVRLESGQGVMAR